MQKHQYTRPSVKLLGSVSDLTRTGLTTPATDGKGGSVASQGV
jgi:hypothetical protein